MKFLLPFLLFLFQCSFSQTIEDFKTLPALKWRFPTKGPIVSSPVVDKNTIYAGSEDSTLYALDAVTGTIKWRVTINGPIKSTVCVDKERVYLVGGDGIVRSFAKESGSELWQFKTGGEQLYGLYSYADYYHSSPVLYNNALYFGSGDSNVYALNAASGKLLWSYKTGEVVHSSPVIDSNKLFIGSFDGNLYALRAENGELLWKFKSVGHRFFPKGEMQGSPAIGNGLVYIGSRDYNVYALDKEKGYCHWNRQFPLGWAMALTCRDTTLYIGTSDDDLMLAVDGRTGKELWKTNVKFNTFGTCAFSASMLYFGTLMGTVIGMDMKSGAIGWRLTTDGYNSHHEKYFKSEEEIVKNDFYAIVQTPEGYINALHELGAIFSRPAITENTIVITSTDGTVYCFAR
ncbi:MAG: hypothetical protein EPO24_05550 [Bacteroidetes bacterium]|nr:MAG: hypothetical protein EPO24_05550 [Bacteroidota bacterium]